MYDWTDDKAASRAEAAETGEAVTVTTCAGRKTWAGVVVMWLPIPEMNGNWLWWGKTTHPDDSTPYINLYRDMYDYLTNVKGLDNLLWVYLPQGNEWPGYIDPVEWAYPGGQYVHIVGCTLLDWSLAIPFYDTLTSFDRPIAIPGYAPFGFSGKGALSGTFDNRRYIETLRSLSRLFHSSNDSFGFLPAP